MTNFSILNKQRILIMSDSLSEIHVDDIGTVFRCTMYDDSTLVDLSDSTSLLLTLKDPNGNLYTKTAELYTDGSDGILQYTSVSGDINVVGKWSIQAKIITSNGQWNSNISNFMVYDNL